MKNLTKKRPAFNWTAFLVLLLILEFVIFGGTNAKFLKPALLMTSANDFLPICIISIFVTFVMITGGIDIQVASIIGLTSIIIGVAWQDFGLNIWAAVLVAILVAAAGGQQIVHRPAAVDRHDGATALVVRRVEGNRKCQLQFPLRQLVDPVHQTAGGQADVAHADVQSLRTVDQL